MTLTPLFMIGLAALGVSGAAWCVLRGLIRGRSTPAVPRDLDRLDGPALLSTLDGTVLWRNNRMVDLAPAADTVARVVGNLSSNGAESMVYRLGRRAIGSGFAVERLDPADTVSRRHLAARSAGEGRLVWSVLDADRLATIVPDFAPASPETTDQRPGSSPTSAQSTTTGMQVLDALPVAVAQFDRSGRLLQCNGRARRVLGERARPGAAFSDLLEPVRRPAASLLSEAFEADPDHPVPTESARLPGGDGAVEIALARKPCNGADTLLAVITDASEMRRLEDQFAQSQKMEAIGKLAGGVAHDFNNVLTAILGHCDLLLLRHEAGDADYADLTQISQNANRAAALVRQLLAFSRKQTLSPVTLSVRDVLSDAHYLLDRLVGEAVRLDVDFGPDLWPVRADQQQLEQVLMNLVVNARDAMQGTGSIAISVANVPAGGAVGEAGEGDFVEIGLRDSGPGFEAGVIDKVFDPFFTTKEKGEGTGLGLSTVYGIIRQSGGFIKAENAPGGGARISIRLPRATDRPVEPPSEEEPAARLQRDQTGTAAVMLVEDEAPVRAFARRALALRGYQVTPAETAEEALDILRDPEHPVDLLVSDVVMPGMDGPTFAAEARKLRPGLRLVFVSGYAEESFRENLTETDFLFLPKPFSLDQLTAAVKTALGDGPA